jgi:hypothetical protein
MGRIVYTAFLAALVLLAAAVPASAGIWSIQTTRELEQNTNLDGISCVTKAACTSVGDSRDLSESTVPVSATWNGKEWTIEEAPSPAEGKSASLRSVSCSVVKFTECTAVGLYFDTSNTQRSLAERWNGETWTVQKTPNPSGSTYDYLGSVSCAVVKLTECTTVGNYQNSSGELLSLAEMWNGEEWTIQETPNPEEGKSIVLLGVSCVVVKLRECTAVGGYSTKANSSSNLAEHWNGKAWAIQTAPDPGGAKYAKFGEHFMPVSNIMHRSRHI